MYQSTFVACGVNQYDFAHVIRKIIVANNIHEATDWQLIAL